MKLVSFLFQRREFLNAVLQDIDDNDPSKQMGKLLMCLRQNAITEVNQNDMQEVLQQLQDLCEDVDVANSKLSMLLLKISSFVFIFEYL